ncbi:MAG: thymidine kinase [Candidatus Spechtbacterales bacterium]|nr:thymidine kinase [Candidatus Spechtbacterales bacterium]
MKKGRLTAIVGCMFSGKTEELVRLVRREKYANRKALFFKPDIDTRYSKDKVVSHSGVEEDATCISVEKPDAIFEYITDDIDVVGIEEVQFFCPEILSVVNELIERGVDIFVCGLDLDYRGELFGQTHKLMALADKGLKLSAICMVDGCGNKASRTQRLSKEEGTVVIGETDKYQARCRDHYIAPK